MDIKPSEWMAYRASLELSNEDVVFVGIGLPNLACNLARLTHAPDLFMIYESGAVGTIPDRLPISIGDPALVTDSLAVVPQADIFQCFLQRGWISVGFLGGAQIDPQGNINTTTIGSDYYNPKVRLPGSGGACEIATHAQRLLVIMPLSPRAFVPKVDFVTSPGHRFHNQTRTELGLPGAGPTTLITDHAVFEYHENQFKVRELYEGRTLDSLKPLMGWEPVAHPKLSIGKPPSAEVIGVLRKLAPSAAHS